MKHEECDKMTLFLLSNGDLPVVKSQKLYEYSWSQGIKPLDEKGLKPDLLVRKKRRGPGMRNGVRNTN